MHATRSPASTKPPSIRAAAAAEWPAVGLLWPASAEAVNVERKARPAHPSMQLKDAQQGFQTRETRQLPRNITLLSNIQIPPQPPPKARQGVCKKSGMRQFGYSGTVSSGAVLRNKNHCVIQHGIKVQVAIRLWMPAEEALWQGQKVNIETPSCCCVG